MGFADLKNDFVFRRIFASRPDILRGLLNDLLEREGDETIETIEYLPSEQLPLVIGAKLSILDVRCKDRAGTTFVVEMQLIHVPGFINRVVYNACKAYVSQLKKRGKYAQLADVVAISICDFVLWPDAEQDRQNLPRVPMLSRWNMTERGTGNRGLLQVQYAFLELPKLPDRKPETGADVWAWLFVHTPEFTEVPAGLPPGPYREAVELANEATFTETEHDAYQKVWDEIEQARALMELADTALARAETAEAKVKTAEAKAKTAAKTAEAKVKTAEAKVKTAEAKAKATEAKAKATAVLAVLAARGITVNDEARARIEVCSDVATLDLWIKRAATAASVDEVISADSKNAKRVRG